MRLSSSHSLCCIELLKLPPPVALSSCSCSPLHFLRDLLLRSLGRPGFFFVVDGAAAEEDAREGAREAVREKAEGARRVQGRRLQALRGLEKSQSVSSPRSGTLVSPCINCA